MDKIGERIAYIIDKECGGNRSQFARKIGITPAFSAQLYDGTRLPSDRTISDICRVFGVNRIWLETGAGEPYQVESRDEQIARILGSAIGGSATAKNRFIRAVSSLPDEKFDWLEHMLLDLAEKMKEEETE